MRLIAIITARGGSKGLHRKNVLDLGGKPLIAWTIEAALKSKIFDKVVVTTDDKEIKEVSLKFGAEIVNRPSELATDTASSLDVIEHTLSIYKKESFTHFVLLQPTSPLRNFEHIQDAWRVYIEKNANSLVSVVEVEHSPFKMLIEKEGEIKPLTKWGDLTKPRQQLPVAYMPNGAIYISKIENFLKTKNLFCSPLDIFKMDKTSSIDIDNRDDFDRIERIIDVN
jgi:CMP-N-acetylneuraminic acid synthetase